MQQFTKIDDSMLKMQLFEFLHQQLQQSYFKYII